MSKIAIAGLQLAAVNGDNTDSMEQEIDAAIRRYPWLDMIVAAELNACGTSVEHAEPMPGPREQRFCEIAKRHGIWLVPGSMFERDGEHVYNTVPVINPDGDVVVRYRKLFPWLPYEKGTTPGSEFAVFDIPGVGRFGLSNCYDIWFPETLRTLTSMGAEVILHPSLTSSIDRSAEHSIIKASAAQFQSYIFDVNLGPSVGCGQSLIAGPGGETLYSAGRDREVIPLKLDLDYVRDVRENGWNNLCQTLKSFRDSAVDFPACSVAGRSGYLQTLGPLQTPGRLTSGGTEPDN